MVMVGRGPASVVNSSSGRKLLPERSGDSEMFTGRSGALDWVVAMVGFAAQVGWLVKECVPVQGVERMSAQWATRRSVS